METITKTLENILNGLNIGGEIEASAIISKDGLLMASGITNGFNPEIFAAFSAAIQNVAEISASKVNKGGVVNRTIVETQEKKIITESVDSNSLLVVVAKNQAKLGLVLFKLGKATSKIKEAL